MANHKKDSLIEYLDTRTSDVQKASALLIADERKDESDIEKIRANIFQIAKTVFTASQKTFQEENEQLEFLDSKLTIISQSWKDSLAKAEKHHDELRILQEQVKLETMNEIQNKLKEIWKTPE